MITIGGENLHAFVGVNGPYEIDGDPTKLNPAAMGLSISGVDFAIALAKPTRTPWPATTVATGSRSRRTRTTSASSASTS